jgi:hypothetical protein
MGSIPEPETWAEVSAANMPAAHKTTARKRDMVCLSWVEKSAGTTV